MIAAAFAKDVIGLAIARAEDGATTGQLLPSSLALALLPWLHLRFAVPAALLVAALTFAHARAAARRPAVWLAVIFFAFGIAFEIPVAVFLVIWIGLVEPEDLVEKRPYVIVFCFVVGMLLTPPDPFSQTMLALPMWGLFELGILCGRFIKKKQAAQEEAVGVVDGAGAHRLRRHLAGHDQLVAGGEEGHARAALARVVTTVTRLRTFSSLLCGTHGAASSSLRRTLRPSERFG